MKLIEWNEKKYVNIKHKIPEQKGEVHTVNKELPH